MRRFGWLCAAALAAAPAMGWAADPVRLALNGWQGQEITTRLAGAILGEAGIAVEYVEADYAQMWTALGQGTLHGALEVWSSNLPEGYHKGLATGALMSLGPLGVVPQQGIAYSPAAAETCPTLPEWWALAPCSAIFALPETTPTGRLIDFPESWGISGGERLRALGQPFERVSAADEAGLIGEIASAFDGDRPLLVTFWRPHWAVSAYELDFVALPEATPQCLSDPAWGPNPVQPGDCGFPATEVVKIAWGGLENANPRAFAILSEFQLATDDQEAMMARITRDGVTVDAAVAEWLAINQEAWRPMVEASRPG